MAVPFYPADELPTEDEVAAFEREIGFELPLAYRDFLLKYNGGKFPHLLSVTPDPMAEGIVQWYLELHRPDEPPESDDYFMLNSMYRLCRSWRDPIRDVREAYRVSLDWAHPRELLPIGHDPGNRQCFLCLSGRRAGAILLAGEASAEKYMNEQFDAITPDDYSLLAESFEAFIGSLDWRAHRVEPVEPPERVNHPTLGHINTWLRSDNSEHQIAALRAIQKGDILQKKDIGVEVLWSDLLPPLLSQPNADVRWLAAELLLKHAHIKDIGAFVPHLEALFDDASNPSWLKAIKGDAFAVGRVARRAVALYCVHHRKVERLRDLIAEGGRSTIDASRALRSTNDADLIAPLLPVLAEAQRAPEERLRQTAAAALAHLYWLNRRWDQLRELLISDDEAVRLGTIAELDDLAESRRDKDLEPLLPELLSIVGQRDRSFKRTREAVARVLAWVVMNRLPTRKDHLGISDVDVPESFILHGVDVMKFPEIKANLREP